MEDSIKLRIRQKDYKDLFLCFCGEADCKPLHHYGPAVKPSYVIHYITKGKGTYTVNGHSYELCAGQGFIIYPNILTEYEADESDPWSYFWIGFDGSKADSYLKTAGFSHNNLIFTSSEGGLLKEYVNDMLEHNNISPSNELRLQGLLYMFLSVISSNAAPSPADNLGNTGIYVSKAIEYIQNNYYNDIHVSDIASYVSLNRSYLTTIFTSALGQSPQQYLTTFRITRAAELLRLTNLSIGDTARSCGYTDIFTFSKAFKKLKGVNPSKFRKENR